MLFFVSDLLYTITGNQTSPEKTYKYQCTNCNRKYRSRQGINGHIRFECGKEPQFQCPHCPHRTKHKGSLKCHVISKHLKMNNLP